MLMIHVSTMTSLFTAVYIQFKLSPPPHTLLRYCELYFVRTVKEECTVVVDDVGIVVSCMYLW